MKLRPVLSWLLVPLLATVLAGPVNADSPPDLEAQRALFKSTEEALKAQDREAFREGLAALDDYPLHAYLVYADIESRLDTAKPREVKAYLRTYSDTPYAGQLRYRWLTHLADEKRWADLVREFDGRSGSTTLKCHYRQALLERGRTGEALDGVADIWLTGRSLPDACDPVLDAWRDADGLTPAMAWGRIALAMEAGQPGLARYVSDYLPEGEQAWAQQWLTLYRRPAEVAQAGFTAAAHPQANAMLTQAWLRLARQEPGQALELWARHGATQALPDVQRREIERTIALRLVLRTGAESLPHLATVPDETFDPQLREWHVRAALAGGDWRTALGAIEAMDPQQRAEDGWQYWKARALEALGRGEEARALYASLAENRNFYGFMAADRAGLPYRMGHRPLAADPVRVQALAEKPAMLRAREWLALDRNIEARREWERTLSGLGADDLRAASQLADSWGWHDRAIFAAAHAQEYDDIELRFPLAHARLVMEHAARQGINPAWAMAVARQESAFMVDARSHAGAMGLMQIMPATGRAMAKHVDMKLGHPYELLDPEVNIPIGTYYLSRNLKRFGGHPILSIAAYNAGAHRVDEWLPKEGAMDADIWAELIPYHETRKYVRRVLAYQVIYEMRLGLAPTRLSSLLPPITSESDLEASRVAHYEQWEADNGELAMFARVCEAPGAQDAPCS